MVITRNGVDIELTKDEVYEAYKEHNFEMCKSDVEAYIDSKDVSIKDEYVECLTSIMEDAHEHWETEPDYQNDVFEVFEGMLDSYGIDINDPASMEQAFEKQETELDEVVEDIEDNMPKTTEELLDEIREVAENQGWSVVFDSQEKCVTFAQSSPLGEDYWTNEIPYENAADLKYQIAEYARDFDVNDHASSYVNMRGQFGIPDDVEALVDDAKDIKEMLNDLSKAVSEVNTRNEITGNEKDTVERDEEAR